MKVSVNWLREFVDIDMPIDELVEKIGAQLGAVEEVVDLAPKYRGIIIVKVARRERHPDADNLSLCLIDDDGKAKGIKRDKSGFIQVVCGAPNVKTGMLAVWLPPGVTVPGSYGKEPLVLTAREIRGQVSHGMLASADELDLGDDHSTIVEIPPLDAKPGDDFAEVYQLNDYVIDIENKMFTRRPDCFGILGVAREVAGITGRPFASPSVYLQPNSDGKKSGNALPFKVINAIPAAVPRFMARVFENVRVESSPVWLRARLAKLGVKPINNVVDITNYFMIMTGQPMHAYDYDKLPAKSLETRLSKKGETLKLLGGKTIKLKDNETILITSGGKPVGIGGIMGGQETEVGETTKTIALECANFDMYATRRASMTYGLFTDAAARFLRGQSPLQCDRVLAWATSELVRTAGATPSGVILDEGRKLRSPLPVHVRGDFINARLGADFSLAAMATTLANVEFAVRVNGPTLAVTPPFWRTDIEIPEDVVEEVGRLIGYDKLPMSLPARTIMPPPRNQLIDLATKLRGALAAAGANEALTYSFVPGDLLKKCRQDGSKAFGLANAISPDLHYYRLSLTPSLLEKVHPNIKAGHDVFAIFEIGKTHLKGEMDEFEPTVPREISAVSLVLAAEDKLAARDYPGAAYYHALVYLTYLMERLAPARATELVPLDQAATHRNPWLEQVAAPFEPKRAAALTDGSGLIRGVVGEYRASVRRGLKLPNFCAGFELDPRLFFAETEAKAAYRPPSRFPKVEQDMTIRVPAGLNLAEVDKLVAAAIDELAGARQVRVDRRLTDIYQAEGGDSKHITYRFQVTPFERTLEAGEANDLLDKLAAFVGERQDAERV